VGVITVSLGWSGDDHRICETLSSRAVCCVYTARTALESGLVEPGVGYVAKWLKTRLIAIGGVVR
jgi:hypothetical protein